MTLNMGRKSDGKVTHISAPHAIVYGLVHSSPSRNYFPLETQDFGIANIPPGIHRRFRFR